MQPLTGYSIAGGWGGNDQDKGQNWNNKEIWAATIY